MLRLGVTDYAEALELQRDVARRRAEGSLPDALVLLQHPHTYTLGRRAGESDVLLEADGLEEIGASVYNTDRGGEATYHGPGQLVGYPIVDVRPLGGASGLRPHPGDIAHRYAGGLWHSGRAARRPAGGLGGPREDSLHRRQDKPGHHHSRLCTQRKPGPLLLPAHCALRHRGSGSYVNGAHLGQARVLWTTWRTAWRVTLGGCSTGMWWGGGRLTWSSFAGRERRQNEKRSLSPSDRGGRRGRGPEPGASSSSWRVPPLLQETLEVVAAQLLSLILRQAGPDPVLVTLQGQ